MILDLTALLIYFLYNVHIDTLSRNQKPHVGTIRDRNIALPKQSNLFLPMV